MTMIKLCKSGPTVDVESTNLVVLAIDSLVLSSRLKKLLVCFDNQKKTNITHWKVDVVGYSKKVEGRHGKTQDPNETSKFTCCYNMGKTAWLAKLQSVLMLCMQCPLFTPNTMTSKKQRNKPPIKIKNLLMVCLNLPSWKHQAL